MNNSKLNYSSPFESIINCINARKNFILLAGPGSGKTKTLVDIVTFISNNRSGYLDRNEKIALITYTNAAKDEVLSRLDDQSFITCSTLHSFCWSLIKDFKVEIYYYLSQKRELILELSEFLDKNIDYVGTDYSISEDQICLAHDDVINITIKILGSRNGKKFLLSRYPFVFIDEYQDTNSEFIRSLIGHHDGDNYAPLLGFFGDDWQRIYRDKSENKAPYNLSNFVTLESNINYRSNKLIVDFLGKLRPTYIQQAANDDHDLRPPLLLRMKGIVDTSNRLQTALYLCQKKLNEMNWRFEGLFPAAILFLTQKKKAEYLKFLNLENVFQYPNKNKLRELEDPLVDFLVSTLETSIEDFEKKKYAEIINKFGFSNMTSTNKVLIYNVFDRLAKDRLKFSVYDVLKIIFELKAVSTLLYGLADFLNNDYKVRKDYYKKIYQLEYKEVYFFANSLKDSNFIKTQHSSKGNQFEKVLVVCTQSNWPDFNFDNFFSNLDQRINAESNISSPDLTRNLFYVSCSRAQKELAVLIDDSFSQRSIENLEKLFNHYVIYLDPKEN